MVIQGEGPSEHEHTAHQEEAAKLADVVRYIDEQRLRLEGQMPATAAHQETANEIQKILEANADSLYRALDQPYFGRLDYVVEDEKEPAAGAAGAPPRGRGPVVAVAEDDESEDTPPQFQTIYLGIVFVPGKGIYSWTSPVGKLWYNPSQDDGYTAPRGHVPARVDLKRYLRIRDRRLEGLNDIFRRRLPAPPDGAQKVLTEALSGVGSEDGRREIIVETIEPDQYENIANVSDKVLIVQGAAGSGKSDIGLHRIAYLLSPHNEIAEHERPTPSTTLFVGPSKAFLEYAADVLPSLGVTAEVEQVRFSDWIAGLLSAPTPARPRIWNNLLDKGEMTRFDKDAETFKGSLAMADAIDRYVAETVASVRRRCLRLSGNIPGLGTAPRLSGAEIRSIVKEVLPSSSREWRLNRRREDFIGRIVRAVLSTGRGVQTSLFAPESRRQADRGELDRRRAETRSAVSRWCDRAWRHLDFKEGYVALLSDAERMIRLAGPSLSQDVAAELAESADRIRNQGFGQGFDDSDIGALAYLDNLLNGTIDRSYRHVVVDEAQDISPIEFKLLAASSTNNWFTVLGDTAQRLTPYRGIRSWRHVERVFGRSEIEIQRARRSYRSTRQITEFNNRILRTYDKNIAAPIPFEREGHRVEYNRHRDTAAMYQGIVDDVERVRSLDGLENAVVAILVRDQRNLNQFRRYCENLGLSDAVLVGQEHHSDARTVLARIPDVKGLEYDAVLLIGVNDSFDDTVFNKRLLYLATTRAKHYLGIHWSGRQSPILESISDRGISWSRGRSSV